MFNIPKAECQGTWRERPNLETEDTLLVCDGCGEHAVIHDGKMINLGIPPKKEVGS